MNPALLNIAIQELPSIIAFLKIQFGKKNPDAPQPSDAEVIAAYNVAFQASVDKDDQWLAQHPNL